MIFIPPLKIALAHILFVWVFYCLLIVPFTSTVSVFKKNRNDRCNILPQMLFLTCWIFISNELFLFCSQYLHSEYFIFSGSPVLTTLARVSYPDSHFKLTWKAVKLSFWSVITEVCAIFVTINSAQPVEKALLSFFQSVWMPKAMQFQLNGKEPSKTPHPLPQSAFSSPRSCMSAS